MILFFIWKRMFEFFDNPSLFPRSNNFCYPGASKTLKQSPPPALGQGCSLPLGGQIWEAPEVCLLILGQILESPPQIPVKLSSWGLSISLLLFLCCYYYKCDSQRWLYLGIQHPGRKEKKEKEERSGEHVSIQALPYTVHSFHQTIPLSLLSPNSH